MGIDRHELEHRNWRWPSDKPVKHEGVQQDVPVVPDDAQDISPTVAAKTPRKPRSKVKSDS